MSLPQDNRREIRPDNAGSIARPWSPTNHSMSVGRKKLDTGDPEHRQWCFQRIIIAALSVWTKFWMLFSIIHWKPSMEIPIARQYHLAVICTENMWNESLLIHLMLKAVFVFAEKRISDWYARSIVIFCKAFDIRRSIHDGNLGGPWYIPRSRIGVGNDGSRIPQYWVDIWSRDPNGYHDVSVPAGISIVNISSTSQNFYMRWEIVFDLFSVLYSIHYVLSTNCSGKRIFSSD
jgi:hypothetical protein